MKSHLAHGLVEQLVGHGGPAMLATVRPQAELPVQAMMDSVLTTRVHGHGTRVFAGQHGSKLQVTLDGSMITS